MLLKMFERCTRYKPAAPAEAESRFIGTIAEAWFLPLWKKAHYIH